MSRDASSSPFSMARISMVYLVPGPVSTVTRSPTRRPSRAFPTGDSLLIRPFRASWRKVVTIWIVISCWVSPWKTVTLSNRPLVTSGKVVTVSVKEGQRTDLMLTLDGQLLFPLKENDTITIEKSRSKALLIKSLRRNFTEVIRDKLHWSGGMHA